MSIRVVVADDHPIVLTGLEQLFQLEDDIEVVGRCVDGEETIDSVTRAEPDVLVLDLRMPLRDGFSVIREMRKRNLATRIIMLTAALSEDEVVEAITLGVSGLVMKEMAPTALIECVRKVHAGGEWLDGEAVGRALKKVLSEKNERTQSRPSLTQRELEIVRLVAGGLRNREVANKLKITEGTVKIHLHSIYEKLGVSGRVELLLFARESGIV